MANTVSLTHTAEQLDSAITSILSRQLEADDIDVFTADIPTGATVAVGGIAGWLEPYIMSGSVL
ncbi:MAG: hypothetical protein IJT91_05365 [Clostridia bacterium]|nr:hypothetical protein [Clostridia bacterium]